MHYLYLITRDDGEQYVGVTRYPFRRMKEHFTGNGSKELKGRSFIHDILAEGFETDIYKAEFDYIQKYGPSLNKAVGGQGGSAPNSNLGSTNGRSKLSESTAYELRELVAGGVPRAEVAERFEISKETVNHIAAGRTWKHVGGPISKLQLTKVIGEEVIREIRLLREQGYTYQSIADKLGISLSSAYKYGVGLK